MLSILIPTYDENVHSLVVDLQEQASSLSVLWEILVNDQCPNGLNKKVNSSLSEIEGVEVSYWNEKKGRSANRNFLADKAKGNLLLFLDSDSEVVSSTFLSDFVNQSEEGKATCGLMYYQDEDPGTSFRLRWRYGRNREMKPARVRNENPYKSFISFAFTIHKTDFQKVRFDEDIIEYGHEDTLFGKHLKYAFIEPYHTDIPLKHTGLIPAADFIEKVDQSIRSLKTLWEQGKVDEDFRVYAMQQRMAKMRLDYLIAGLWKLFKGVLIWNLKSPYPSLTLLDLYKLGYFCTLTRGVKTSAKTLRS